MITKTLLASFCALACTVSAHAVTVLNDFTSSTGATNTLVIGSFGHQVGESFVTGGTLLTLSNVVFPQVQQDASGNNVDGFNSAETFALYANNPVDNTALLAAPLYTFSLTDNTKAGTGFGDPTFGVVTATPTASVPLLANTRYWLVLTYGPVSDPTGSVVYPNWDYTASASYFSNNQYGVTLPTANASFSTNVTTGTNEYSSLADGPQLVIINAVPEPSTYCLLAVAGLAFVVSRKRLRKVA